MDHHRASLSHFETLRDNKEKASSFVPAVTGHFSPVRRGKVARVMRSSKSRLAKLKWYGARLAAMSPAEIVHRIYEVRARAALASEKGGWDAVKTRVLRDVNFSRLTHALAAVETVTPRADPVFLGRVWPKLKRSDGVLSGHEWFLDPVSLRHWPAQESNAFSIDVRSTAAIPREGRPFGDVKYVWEPNRLQVLQPLACRVAREGCNGTAWARAMGWIASWMEANPPYRGVNWSSGIEVALRVASVALLIAAANGKVPERDRTTLATFIEAHARWLASLPSLYSSANNHRVAEGLGLFLAGLLLVNGAAYEDEGRDILQEQTYLQILPDGVGVEQSPTYQAFTMELIGTGALFAAAANKPFDKAIVERLGKGVEFLFALLDRAGRAFSIGDDDEGRVVCNPDVCEPLYVSSVARSIGALAGLQIVDVNAPDYMRETLFAAFAAEAQRTLQRRAFRHFGKGGYSIFETSMAKRNIQLAFDHGPLGFGKLAAHGHADALAIWLNVDDQPVFIDAGTYLYHSGEGLRNALRGSPAHNTLVVSGASQSTPSSAFSWSHVAKAHWCGADVAACSDSIPVMTGAHDGYLRAFGIRHRRSVEINGSEIIVRDRLDGRSGASPVEISFLCAPEYSRRRGIWLRDAFAHG